ncbi:41414_t:CDS:2, partial [Gigaspora margarita]
FRQQYPTSSLIEAQYQTRKTTFYNGVQYLISDEYCVETSLLKKQNNVKQNISQIE